MQCESVPDLDSIQEEADTRLLFHAEQAARHWAEVVVLESPDPDMAAIACACAVVNAIPILLRLGTQHLTCCVNISFLSHKFGSICDAMIGIRMP